MAVEWSGLGPDVLVALDRNAAVPLRAQLEDQFRQAIRSGRLAHGERMPSSRVLAKALGLSRGLVQECYEQLQAEGYLVARGGSATRVARPAGQVSGPSRRPPPAPPSQLAADFKSGVPDLASVPREDLAWAIREACRTAPNTAFDYGDPQGHPQLREVLAAYLRRVRAADAVAGQVVICSGMAQALWLILRALAGQGVRRVAFEDPGSTGTVTAAATSAGLEAVPVPVDESGVDVAALQATGAGAVVLTPAHQWPTGVVLAPERRLALLDWATRQGATIIEDDYDAEFRYDRDPVGTIQGLAPDRVVALGTVSKSLAPTLRLGWIVSPPALAGDLTRAKHLTDRGSPGLDQLALAILIEAGRYDRHLRRMRTEYAARRDVLIRALADHAPQVRLTGLAAGFHAMAHLPGRTSEDAVIRAARARSVGLYGMSSYRNDHSSEPPQLVLGFGNLSQRAIQTGIAAIGDLLVPGPPESAGPPPAHRDSPSPNSLTNDFQWWGLLRV
ncbi:MAG TPA: PLP-dependent aminotransferase family protein [Streptosporangiaceae bacterium]|nr:PLP-dependent aminotransferase family protein [Streptosporangiaceae bacterium]